MNNSLDVLSESLDQKIAVLKEIEKYNEEQKKAFETESIDMEQFDEAIEEKDRLIDQLSKLDDGFEALYARIAEELNGNRDKYADKIRELQNKITVITELSMTVQASEARNKKLIEQFFEIKKKNIRTGRVGSKAAYDYYKNMAGTNIPEAQFMDSKN